MTALRSKLIRLAADQPRLRPHLLGLLQRTARGEAPEEEEAEAGGGSSGKPSGKFVEFMKEVGDQRVRNPDTGNQVKVKSLKGPKGKALVQKKYREWLDAQEKDNKGTPSKASPAKAEPSGAFSGKAGIPQPKWKPNRYEGDDLKVRAKIDLGKPPPRGALKTVMEAFDKKLGGLSVESVADLMGVPLILEAGKGGMTVSGAPDGKSVNISIKGPHVSEMFRELRLDENGEPYIYNDAMILDFDAPKGFGTKLFASQVAQARAAGIKKIKCFAWSDPDDDFIGYKVWPKLGYDGPIPLDEPADELSEKAPPIPKKIEDRIKAAGFKKPYMVSHLYRVEGGQEWWEENGVTFDATFDLTDNSLSLQVLQAYLERKAKQADTSPDKWMAKVASKEGKGESKGKGDRITLDDDDLEILSDIWKGLRSTAGKRASLRSKVIRLAHTNPILRPHLLPLL